MQRVESCRCYNEIYQAIHSPCRTAGAQHEENIADCWSGSRAGCCHTWALRRYGRLRLAMPGGEFTTAHIKGFQTSSIRTEIL